MKYSTKAMLLSAFLFPGVGHFYLKCYLAGAVLASLAVGALYFLLARTIEVAMRVSEMIQQGEVGIDPLSITQALSTQATTADSQVINIATVMILCCFVMAIGDSYRVGRIRDKADGTSGSTA